MENKEKLYAFCFRFTQILIYTTIFLSSILFISYMVSGRSEITFITIFYSYIFGSIIATDILVLTILYFLKTSQKQVLIFIKKLLKCSTILVLFPLIEIFFSLNFTRYILHNDTSSIISNIELSAYEKSYNIDKLLPGKSKSIWIYSGGNEPKAYLTYELNGKKKNDDIGTPFGIFLGFAIDYYIGGTNCFD